MTEKRFQVYKVIGSFHEWSIEDSFDDKVVFGSIMHKYNADRLCAKLNELAEENKELKFFNQDLAENLSVANNREISKDNLIEQLQKENEQLKQKEMDFLEKRYEEVSYLKIKIEGLEKENEQLKQENKELRGDRDYWKTLAQSLARTNGRGDYID